MDLIPATGSTGDLLDDERREEPLVRRQDDKLNVPDPCYTLCSECHLPEKGNRKQVGRRGQHLVDIEARMDMLILGVPRREGAVSAATT